MIALAHDPDANPAVLAAALAYVRRGYAVLPLWWPDPSSPTGCACRRPDCDKPAKHPLGTLVHHGVKDATKDETSVREWWGRYPNANVGIATGAVSGIDVLDVDGEEGRASVAAFDREHGSLPTTGEALTGGGGRHVLFLYRPGLPNAVKFAPGLDVRTDGGYIVAAPSLHVSGRSYAWEVTRDPADVATAAWPGWLVALVVVSRGGATPVARPVAGKITAGERNARLASLAGSMRRRAMEEEEIAVALFAVNARRCLPPLFEEEVRSIAHSVARYAPEEVPFASKARELATELGNARRIVAKHGRNLRWTAAHGFLVWDGKRWRVDDTEAARRFAKSAARGILDEVKHATGRDAEVLAAWALKSQKASVINAALDLARGEDEIVARAEDFDRDPWLLNVKNGTLDLRTGVLREHRREDLITKLAPVEYDPNAKCPVFEAFLARVQPDPEMRAYLQRHAGYCLTGDASDQSFDVAHGPGANGKTTYYETLAYILGDYAAATAFQTFTVKRDGGGASNDLADLAGTRFVRAAEPPEGARLNVAVVKQLTGEDTIRARFLYREHFAFVATFKIVLVANHRPQITETTEAAWRRVHLVPWTVTIPKAERDKALKGKLQREASGILGWALEGCMAYQREGLNPPDVVRAATAEYQREEDAVGSFVAEKCLTGPAYRVRASEFLAAYLNWARASGEADLSAKALGARLRELQFTARKINGVKWWMGLAIRPPEDDPDTQSGDDGDDRTIPGGISPSAPTRGEFTGERSDDPHRPQAEPTEAAERVGIQEETPTTAELRGGRT